MKSLFCGEPGKKCLNVIIWEGCHEGKGRVLPYLVGKSDVIVDISIALMKGPNFVQLWNWIRLMYGFLNQEAESG